MLGRTPAGSEADQNAGSQNPVAMVQCPRRKLKTRTHQARGLVEKPGPIRHQRFLSQHQIHHRRSNRQQPATAVLSGPNDQRLAAQLADSGTDRHQILITIHISQTQPTQLTPIEFDPLCQPVASAAQRNNRAPLTRLNANLMGAIYA